MSVRAKFTVQRVDDDGDDGGTVHMEPVYSGSPENESFYRWTPSGNIILSTINADALAQFEPGNEFYVDFTPAPKAEETP